MCDTCGCGIPDQPSPSATENNDVVKVMKGLLAENDRLAQHNRDHLNEHNVLAINLMSSPGSGKTALLESTIIKLKDRYRIAVIEGDLETENDAQRIRAHGIEAVQINTGSACHLDANMIHNALHKLDLNTVDLLFIENVGNLVCPASYDLGHHLNVVLLSVVEGDDKPAKYPVMFRAADLTLITKTDLLAVIDDFDSEHVRNAMQKLGRDIPIMALSAKTGNGMDKWLALLEEKLT
ncbi:MAG: hydrogenase nickel incorporation protein HypB [Magnetococcales bacterium]|nr:hydrogenase nickel incorporation protein HypB [Magnetococcales bacterium]